MKIIYIYFDGGRPHYFGSKSSLNRFLKSTAQDLKDCESDERTVKEIIADLNRYVKVSNLE